jgi:hypothetical protein
VEPKLVEDRNGVFDVMVDDSLIFSMSDAGRFPNPGELAAMFKQ